MEKQDFIGYDYREITVEKNQISAYMDGYECFGWTLDENHQEVFERTVVQNSSEFQKSGKTVLRFKRNRKIINKTELTRLQRYFEDCMRQIAELEQSKIRMGMIAAMIIGIVGCAFMAGSAFAITNEPPLVIACTLLAIPGFTCWILPYFVYRWVSNKKAEQVNPMIEKKQDEVYEICEKGHKLL